MHSVLWVVLPLAVLGLFAAVGFGLSRLLGRSLPTDATIALAPVTGVALLVCASSLVSTGLPFGAVAVGTCAAGIGVTLALVRGFRLRPRELAFPAGVAAFALLLVSAPAVARGGWDTSAVANADPYLWVSQAQALLEGPAPAPSADHPDRIAFERIEQDSWSVGLPFLTAVTATVGQSEPEEVYGAFAVVLLALIPLMVYAGARAVFSWSRRSSALVAVLTAANSTLLYAAFNGWQAQLAITLFGVAALLFLRLALEEGPRSRYHLLAGLFAAAGIASYGAVFAVYGLFFAAVVAGYVVTAGRGRPLRIHAAAIGSFTVATVAFAHVAIVRALDQFRTLVGHANSDWWDEYGRAFPDEALGLMPRVGSSSRAPLFWSLLTLALTFLLLVLGIRELHRRGHRSDVLVATIGAAVVAIAVLQVPQTNPYLSLKIVGYTTPLFMLAAFAGIQATMGTPRGRRLLAATAPLFVLATGMSMVQGFIAKSSEPYAGVANALRDDPGSGVTIDVTDDWQQVWLVYYLRRRPVTVVRPIVHIVGMGPEDRRLNDRPTRYRVRAGTSRAPLWRADGLALERVALRPEGTPAATHPEEVRSEPTSPTAARAGAAG